MAHTPISRGFVYVRDNEELIKRAQEIVQDMVKKRVPAKVLESKIKDALTTFTAKEIDPTTSPAATVSS